jgi:hypothetical protein
MQMYRDKLRDLVATGFKGDPDALAKRVNEFRNTIEQEYLRRSAARALSKHNVADAAYLLPAIQDVYSALERLRRGQEQSLEDSLSALLDAEIELNRWMLKFDEMTLERRFIGISSSGADAASSDTPVFSATFRVREHGHVRIESYSEPALEAIIALTMEAGEDARPLLNALRRLRAANKSGRSPST